MSNFIIEKNIPYERRAGKTKYPFQKMEVGDSFVGQNVNSVTAACRFGKDNNMEFRSARLQDGSFRIWRTK